MGAFRLLLIAFLVAFLPSGPRAASISPATFNKAELADPFLLQVSYEQKSGRQDFRTSRSRIVTFRREGAFLRMFDRTDERGGAAARPLAAIPIRDEDRSRVELDLNAGFDTIHVAEDRTGEDYYGRIARDDESEFRLLDRKAVSISYHGKTLVFDQEARTEDGQRILVHYYLGPYRPAADFRPFEMKDLRHFGFYQTYPQWRSGEWVLYATKFNAHEPIVFALAPSIPAQRRAAIRDGVLYWNQAFGKPLVHVIDAPPGVRAPDPDYNVIEWALSGDYTSTSYIQSDPLTGQILHAHLFILPETMMTGDLDEQNDHLRYIVAHEIGHALGLRHNFASAEPTTVMGYFTLPQILEIGRSIRVGAAALPYDRAVVPHVYLGAPLDVDTLPPFCTDSQRGCRPMRVTPKEADGISGR